MSRRDDVPPPPELPGYTWQADLGKGGFARVYRYREDALGREVAIKVMNQRVTGADQDSFLAEANVMAQVGDHPSIVNIFRADITPDGRPFMAMELCARDHLGARLRAQAMPVDVALHLIIQIAGAVETAHLMDVLHRDIKPANILFTRFKRPALTDFGIAAATGHAAQGGAEGMSVPWAPPEQLTKGAPMGPPGDVYSLAATLYTVLARRPPLWQPGGSNDQMAMAVRVRNQAPPPIRREDVPESLEQAIAVALAKKPEQRFGSALEFARALQRVQAELRFPVTSPEVVQLDEFDADDAEDDGSGTRITSFVAIDPDGDPHPTSTSLGVSFEPPPAPSPVGGTDVIDRVPSDTGTHSMQGTQGDQDSSRWAAATTTGSAQAPAPRLANDWHDDAGTQQRTPLDRPAGQSPVAEEAADGPAAAPRRLVGGAVAAVLVLGLGGLAAATVLGGDADGTTSAEPAAPTATSRPQDPIADTVPAPRDVTVTRRGDRLVVRWSNPDPETGDTYALRVLDPTGGGPAYTYVEQTRGTLEALPGRECVEVALVRADGRSSGQPTTACPGEAAS